MFNECYDDDDDEEEEEVEEEEEEEKGGGREVRSAGISWETLPRDRSC